MSDTFGIPTGHGYKLYEIRNIIHEYLIYCKSPRNSSQLIV